MLDDAAARIKSRGRWTTSANARNDVGLPCSPTDELACKWCLLGSLVATRDRFVNNGEAQASETYEQLGHLLMLKANEFAKVSYVGVNDDLGFRAVHKLLQATRDELVREGAQQR